MKLRLHAASHTNPHFRIHRPAEKVFVNKNLFHIFIEEKSECQTFFLATLTLDVSIRVVVGFFYCLLMLSKSDVIAYPPTKLKETFTICNKFEKLFLRIFL